jgi:hypothetical protein
MSLTVAEARARRAALALHALADEDRERVLGMLDEPQRSRVQPLLGELQALGIPRGVATPQTAPHAAHRQSGTLSERMAMIDPLAAGAVLARCGAATAAALMRTAPAHWVKNVLAALPPAQRQLVDEQIAAGGMPASKLAETLCSALEDAVRDARGTSSPASSAAGHRLTQRVLQWIR